MEGTDSYGLNFLTNRASHASLTLVVALDLPYMVTTYFSKIGMSVSPVTGGCWLSLEKIPDASSYTFHMSHADFFSVPRKADTTSQLLRAWKNRIPLVFFGPTVVLS